MVDLGGSLAVASKGLYSTGVSTDINGIPPWFPLWVGLDGLCWVGWRAKVVVVTYLASGGPVGNRVRAEVTCDKCKSPLSPLAGWFWFWFEAEEEMGWDSWQDVGVHEYQVLE
jgi:hypothetical protein